MILTKCIVKCDTVDCNNEGEVIISLGWRGMDGRIALHQSPNGWRVYDDGGAKCSECNKVKNYV